MKKQNIFLFAFMVIASFVVPSMAKKMDPSKVQIMQNPSAAPQQIDSAKPSVDGKAPPQSAEQIKALIIKNPSAAPQLIDPVVPAEPKPPVDVKAPPQSADKTTSGLFYKVLQKGSGKEHPKADDIVEIHYSGWMTNGTLFDSSVKRGQPIQIPLDKVAKMLSGLSEGIRLMTVGEKRRLWIPANLAYGDTPKRPGAPYGMLVMDVELLRIIAPPKPLPAPADVKAPPSDAKQTASGLSYKVLHKGSGKVHPKATDIVQVHYTGWTTDGKMFDSSVVRGQPAEFPLNQVIKGWTEGVQLMVEGEKTQFWIPGKLGYGEGPSHGGAPMGMLVFQVELIKIK